MVPATIIPSSLDELETEFVRKIATEKRQRLYNGYLTYLTQLKQIIGNKPFKQWVDGSFSTLTLNPGDIDIVSFVNFETVDEFDKALRPLRFPASLQLGIDAYIVRVYPPDHNLFALYDGDRAYWMDRFDKMERNRRGVIHQKGFIELTFPDN